MEINKFFQSKHFKWTTAALGLLIIVFLAFSVGVFVGYHKARFSYAWGENYDRNFGGPRHGIFGEIAGPDFMNPHGTSGPILSINQGSSTISVNDRDGIEKTVLVSSSTQLRKYRDEIQLSDLKVNDLIVVIGTANDQGQIEARLVRVLGENPTQN